MTWEYHAKVERVVDGDTLDLQIDLGFKVHIHARARLFGIDTPEIYGVKKKSKTYKKGMAAKAYVEEWLDEHASPKGDILIKSYSGNDFKAGKYGRWLVCIYPFLYGSGLSLNETLVELGYAKEVEY